MGYSIIDAVSSKYVPSWGNAKEYIAVHYLGVDGQNHDIGSDGCGAHYYIYWDGTIYQRCSHDAIVWQVGTAGTYSQKDPYARNANCIGIEMCCHCDGNASSASDPYWYFTEETQEACVWLVQKLMKELNIPADHVLRHWDIVNKICPAPYYANNKYKTSWTWDEFMAKVSGESVDTSDGTTETKWYRVRLTWDDAASQIGAFIDKQNAIDACLPGYTVYDYEGNAIYTNETSSGDGTQATEFTGLTETEAAAKLLEICTPISVENKLFPSVAAAQTILESGYCTTDLALNANNVCGMKCTLSGNTWANSTWDGVSKYTKNTQEQDSNGNTYTVTADFRKYTCIEDSIADRCAYLLGAMNGSSLRYAGIADCANYKEQIELIKAGGYATDVSYVSKICDLIERYGLDKYDYLITAGEPATDEPDPETSEPEPSTTEPEPETTEPEPGTITGDGWYRVRTSWDNPNSQVGAFAVLDNAINCAKSNPGYNVYDDMGEVMYSSASYTVQAGAFNKKSNADSQVKKIQKKGFDAFVKEEDGMYKIQCGVFSSKTNAENLVKSLKSAGFDAFIK